MHVTCLLKTLAILGSLVTNSCLTLVTPWTVVRQDPLSIGFPRQSYWSGCHFLLQGIFLTQGSNLVLLHCRQSLPTESSGRPISQSQRNEHNKTKTDTFATIQWHQLSSPKLLLLFSSVQFSSVTQSCPTLCDPMNCSMPALPIHHQLPEFTQTHVHQIGDAIQPSHPLTSPSLPAPNPSQH